MKAGVLAFLVLLFCVSNGFASLEGTDNASASAYSTPGTWNNGEDGFITGAGAFGPWNLSTTGFSAGFFRYTSTDLAGPGANIDSSGASFGMWGTGDYSEAKRAFDSPLSVGQTFSIDLAVNSYDNGFKGVNIFDNSNNKLFNFNVGNSKYAVNDLPGTVDISSTHNQNTAFKLSFTQTSLSGGTWSVVRSGGVSSSNSGAYSGVAASLHLYAGGTNGGNTNNLFANNLSLSAVPEASTVLAGTLVLGLVACRRLSKWCWKKA